MMTIRSNNADPLMLCRIAGEGNINNNLAISQGKDTAAITIVPIDNEQQLQHRSTVDTFGKLLVDKYGSEIVNFTSQDLLQEAAISGLKGGVVAKVISRCQVANAAKKAGVDLDQATDVWLTNVLKKDEQSVIKALRYEVINDYEASRNILKRTGEIITVSLYGYQHANLYSQAHHLMVTAYQAGSTAKNATSDKRKAAWLAAYRATQQFSSKAEELRQKIEAPGAFAVNSQTFIERATSSRSVAPTVPPIASLPHATLVWPAEAEMATFEMTKDLPLATDVSSDRPTIPAEQLSPEEKAREKATATVIEARQRVEETKTEWLTLTGKVRQHFEQLNDARSRASAAQLKAAEIIGFHPYSLEDATAALNQARRNDNSGETSIISQADRLAQLVTTLEADGSKMEKDVQKLTLQLQAASANAIKAIASYKVAAATEAAIRNTREDTDFHSTASTEFSAENSNALPNAIAESEEHRSQDQESQATRLLVKETDPLVKDYQDWIATRKDISFEAPVSDPTWRIVGN